MCIRIALHISHIMDTFTTVLDTAIDQATSKRPRESEHEDIMTVIKKQKTVNKLQIVSDILRDIQDDDELKKPVELDGEMFNNAEDLVDRMICVMNDHVTGYHVDNNSDDDDESDQSSDEGGHDGDDDGHPDHYNEDTSEEECDSDEENCSIYSDDTLDCTSEEFRTTKKRRIREIMKEIPNEVWVVIKEVLTYTHLPKSDTSKHVYNSIQDYIEGRHDLGKIQTHIEKLDYEFWESLQSTLIYRNEEFEQFEELCQEEEEEDDDIIDTTEEVVEDIETQEDAYYKAEAELEHELERWFMLRDAAGLPEIEYDWSEGDTTEAIKERTSSIRRECIELLKKSEAARMKQRELTSIDDIRTEQLKTDLIIDRTAFKRLVYEITSDYKTDTKWTPMAIKAIQTAVESHLIQLFDKANYVAINAYRDFIWPRDLSVVDYIERKTDGKA